MFGDVLKFLTDSAYAGLAPNSLAKLQHLILTKGHDLLIEMLESHLLSGLKVTAHLH